jgi:hypothetical protein
MPEEYDETVSGWAGWRGAPHRTSIETVDCVMCGRDTTSPDELCLACRTEYATDHPWRGIYE